TGSAYKERLSAPGRHDLYPRWRVAAMFLEVCQLADVVTFDRSPCPALFAFLVQQAFHPFVTRDIRTLVWLGVLDASHWLTTQGESPESCYKRLFTFAFHADLIASTGTDLRKDPCGIPPDDTTNGCLVLIGERVQHGTQRCVLQAA